MKLLSSIKRGDWSCTAGGGSTKKGGGGGSGEVAGDEREDLRRSGVMTIGTGSRGGEVMSKFATSLVGVVSFLPLLSLPGVLAVVFAVVASCACSS